MLSFLSLRTPGHSPEAVGNYIISVADDSTLTYSDLSDYAYFAHGWCLALLGTPLLRRPLVLDPYTPFSSDIFLYDFDDVEDDQARPMRGLWRQAITGNFSPAERLIMKWAYQNYSRLRTETEAAAIAANEFWIDYVHQLYEPEWISYFDQGAGPPPTWWGRFRAWGWGPELAKAFMYNEVVSHTQIKAIFDRMLHKCTGPARTVERPLLPSPLTLNIARA